MSASKLKLSKKRDPRCKVLCRRRNLLVGQALEDVRDDLVQGLFVVGLQLVLVFAVELLVRQIEIERNLLVLLELHDQEWISGLTLTEGGVKSDNQEAVQVVGFGEHHEFFDGFVLDFVIVCFAAESE